MKYIDITLPDDVAEALFPCKGEEGTLVEPSTWATRVARAMLGESEVVQWHTPDVFAVRYGSSYVATATAGSLAVRFHSDEGDFREGDDK
jgi:hypothetical protein